MIYIYCPKSSCGARDLVSWINKNGGEACRLRTIRNVDWGVEDWIVNWGALVPIGVQKCPGLLNARVIHNKYKELQVLSKAGVECVESSLERYTGWLARRFQHQEANDLLAGLTTGDYYTKFRESSQEFRVHIFSGRSIRLAVKVPRIPHPHPKFRSWLTGWKFSYAAGLGTPALRNIAKRATDALGLDFGAVDVAEEASGNFFVLEVNTRPGLEGGTIAAYGRHIIEAAE